MGVHPHLNAGVGGIWPLQ